MSTWSSDVRISMPLPPKNTRRVPMTGFVFTDGGMAHDIDEAAYAEMSTPTYAPANFGQEVVYDDEDIDRPPLTMETF